MDNAQLLQERKVLQEEQKAVDPAQFAKSFTDIHYAKDSKDQVLDVFLPEKDGVWPVVIFVHGGGWYFGGRREECISSIFKIVSQGYAVATVDYRLVPDVYFPFQIHDVKAAIRYLRAHAKELQINTDKLVVWGNSAGAHLAALAGANGDFPALEDLSMGNEQFSSHVDGVLAWYGLYDILSYQTQMKQVFPGTANSSDNSAWLMLGADASEEKAKAASPVSYVTKDYPPTLLQHGKTDVLVPYLQSQEFYDRICDICGPERAALEYFPTAGHGDPQIKDDSNILRCVRFLDSIYFADQPCTYPRTALPKLRMVASVCDRIDPYEGTMRK
ncbi:alpha/beta fold hydrolase [Hominifimenecus sp. rT4P-3]|uniref:alpha/beta fold hydrolase n=1 Tax=Hominifimenecus sp. rT4P-3 TaxID=3242979 RepID=UPI003DA4B01A